MIQQQLQQLFQNSELCISEWTGAATEMTTLMFPRVSVRVEMNRITAIGSVQFWYLYIKRMSKMQNLLLSMIEHVMTVLYCGHSAVHSNQSG